MGDARISRRDLLRATTGLVGALAAAGLVPGFAVAEDAPASPPPAEPGHVRHRIDYRVAKATPTICFGCTTQCGVLGWVEGGRVRRITGNPLDPNSRGKICAKANGMIAYTYYPERVLYPLRRVGKRGEGKWRRVSWDEALGEVAARLRRLKAESRPEQLAIHVGRDKTQGLTQRFLNAFGSPNALNRRAICSSNPRAGNMSYFGEPVDWDTGDYANTRYILNFGANPMEAHQGGMGAMQRIQEARVDRGAKLVTFEVRPSATAVVSDEYHPVFPGTDGAIAMAMAHVIVAEGLFDEAFWKRWCNLPLADLRTHLGAFTPEVAEKASGVAAATIRRLAREFAAARPHCLTLTNRGTSKHYNGVHAHRAVRLLDILVGGVGRPGGFTMTTRSAWGSDWGQEGLPALPMPEPRPPSPPAWLPGTPMFEALPEAVRERVKRFPPALQARYVGELVTPSEYPLSFQWQVMRVGQLVYPYLKEGRAKLDTYITYVFNSAYNYPESRLAREVLLDESLIPFHVAIDVVYDETTALADLILPETTSLERWDAQVTNAYELVPFTAIRQPLQAPLGEARSYLRILKDLAERVGGGMEAYFVGKDEEDFYRAWHKNLPISWEEFKRRGVWYDTKRPKDYEIHERPLSASELEGSAAEAGTGVIRKEVKGKQRAIGILQDGKAVRGFPSASRKVEVRQDMFPLAADLAGLPADEPCRSPLPTYFPVPTLAALADDELVLVTFKWNVHTQARSGYLKHNLEIVHSNPIWIHPDTARKRGLKDGDLVEVAVLAHKGNVWRSGTGAVVGTLRNRVKLVPGMHPRVLACSHHVGHWEQGALAKGEPAAVSPAAAGHDPALEDRDLPANVWWAKGRGGIGNGVAVNDVFPVSPTPLVGGQNWFDNACRLTKV